MHLMLCAWYGTCKMGRGRSRSAAGVVSMENGSWRRGRKMARENLLSLFEELAQYGGDVAFVQRRGYRREAWRYGKLRAVAEACAQELRKRGVKTGDRVLLWGA